MSHVAGLPPAGHPLADPVPASPAAPIPARETERLAALRRYRVLDTPEEEAFDRLVRLARELFDAESADVSLVDEFRQWLKAHAGPPGAREVARSSSFCAHAILGADVFVVPDARRDARFRTNPLVLDAPGIRFYAGAPLRTPDGHNLGALCVISSAPRRGFSAADRRKLRALADMAMSELELRRVNAELAAGRAALQAEMTRRAQAEAALHEAERLAGLGRLAEGLAHNMNNVLQAASGAAGLLRRHPADAEAVGRLAGVIAEAVERGASITRRMMAFARRDALRPRPLDAGASVAGMTEAIRAVAGPAVAVELRADGGRWAVFCDAEGLQGALLDLAANARDAMPGGGTLTLSVRDLRLDDADVGPNAPRRGRCATGRFAGRSPRDGVELGAVPGAAGRDGAASGDHVEIAVSDTGAGMDAQVLARAFEPFFTTKPVGGGTGLGLSRVHGFARQSGGFVRLDSAPGRGTVARLYLPRHRGDDGRG